MKEPVMAATFGDDKEGRMPKIVPNLWFDTNALEAAEFYVSIFPNSKIVDVAYYGEGAPMPAGTVLVVSFELDGQLHRGINGGPMFTFSEAVSLEVSTADQNETDYYWERLTTDGGNEVQCGWLKDRFGLSWQVVPVGAIALLTDPDPGRRQRATDAMMQMVKLDLAALHAAADGT
jgi:predicted 3-demethylubiquinone-9 3-methyltransferase (glyoxalase superfamily)